MRMRQVQAVLITAPLHDELLSAAKLSTGLVGMAQPTCGSLAGLKREEGPAPLANCLCTSCCIYKNTPLCMSWNQTVGYATTGALG